MTHYLVRMRQLAPLALILVSVAIAVSAYLQALNYPFVYDDVAYIVNNTELVELRLSGLWRLFIEPYNSFREFLPLRELSYWLDIKMFGLNPSAFRMHNIILYLLCLPLVYGTTLKLWQYFRPADAASAPWASAAVTALFVVHPSHVEAVVWIAGRKDVLSGMFSLFALWLAVCAKREQGLSAPHAVAALVALLAAMLSKASAFAVAPVIALLWVIFWRDISAPNRRYSLLLWPLASLFLAGCVALIFATIIQTKIPFYFGIEAVTRTLAVLGWLARLAVSPERRHFFYPVFEDPYLPVMVTLGATVLGAAAIGGVMLLRQRSLEGLALVVFLLLCLPSIQLIPYWPPSLVSDRWLALAVWPAVLLLVALSWRLKPIPRSTLLLVIVLAWSFQTAERTRDWRSLEAVIDTDLRAFPGYYMPAFQKIVWVQMPQGFYPAAGDTAGSIVAPEIKNIMMRLIEADYFLHADVVATGKTKEAMALLWKLWSTIKQEPIVTQWNSPMHHVWQYCKEALVTQWEYLAKKFPDDALVRYNAGLYLLNVPQHEEDAVAHIRAATESQHLPESLRGEAYKNLGLALLKIGHIAESEAPLRAAVEQSPSDLSVHCLLSAVYKQIGRFEEAARAEAGCPARTPGREATQ